MLAEVAPTFPSQYDNGPPFHHHIHNFLALSFPQMSQLPPSTQTRIDNGTSVRAPEMYGRDCRWSLAERLYWDSTPGE
jgi:hypothetical protein